MSQVPQQPVRQKLGKPLRDEKHRKFVASLPCLICGMLGCQAAHIRIGWYRGGQKPPDDRTVPLCATRLGVPGCHDIQHAAQKRLVMGKTGEESFWLRHLKDLHELFTIAGRLYAAKYDEEAGRTIVEGARR